jgi:hypothetical protein
MFTRLLAQLILPATLLGNSPAPASGPVKHGAVTDHVIVVSIDGLRPDAIQRYNLQTLSRLMREGAYTLEARTILPSTTLPSHTSMLTGLAPSVHGVTWNSDRTDELGVVTAPTVFALAKQRGYQRRHSSANPSSIICSNPDRSITHRRRVARQSWQRRRFPMQSVTWKGSAQTSCSCTLRSRTMRGTRLAG